MIILIRNVHLEVT